jgi:hypothetical protein
VTDPNITDVTQDDPLPPEEDEQVEVGAFMGDRAPEPVEDPDPEVGA